MMAMSEQDYYTLYWPKLESAIHLIVQQNPGEFIPISYEEMYSAVYKCVCQQHSGKLYDNLMHLITSILDHVKQDLECQPLEMYLDRFAHIMTQYFQSVEGIAAIFNYMNRFYVKPKRSTDLKSELLGMFSNNIADNPKLFEILSQSSTQPFSTDPQILMSITRGLYSLRPGFAERAPNLFSRFIPNLPTHCTSLDQEIMETKHLQMVLSNSEEFVRGENERKRSLDCSDVSVDGPLRKI